MSGIFYQYRRHPYSNCFSRFHFCVYSFLHHSLRQAKLLIAFTSATRNKNCGRKVCGLQLWTKSEMSNDRSLSPGISQMGYRSILCEGMLPGGFHNNVKKEVNA